MGPIAKLKWLLLLNKIANVIQENSKMKLTTGSVVTTVLSALQIVAQTSGLFTGKWVIIPIAAQGIAQLVVQVMQAYHNPDGTPASQPFVKQ